MATYDLTSSIPKYYLLKTGDILNCPYSGTKKTIQLPAGQYKFECWGAQGGTGYTGVNNPSSINYDTSITSNNYTGYFSRSISSYYFVPDTSGTWSANNLSVDSSTAQTILTCAEAGYYQFVYSYVTESSFDKFTLTVGGTTVASAVSGTSSDNTYSKYLNVDDTIVMTYTKDGSQSASGESVTVTITRGTPTYNSANFTAFPTYEGGKGGYSYQIATLKQGRTTLHCYAGGQGKSSISTERGSNAGGFNGGGNGGRRWWEDIYTSGGGGGGASDVRIEDDSYNSRIVVAGGGGGAAGVNDSLKYGGGLTGYCNNSAYRATQSQAGSGGSFGQGASTDSYTNYKYGAGGGGGGWYGGGAWNGSTDIYSAYRERNGGGSGYCSYNVYQDTYELTTGNTVGGNTSFTSPTGSSETGHSGNGYVRITVLSIGYVSNNLNVSAPGSYNKKLYPGTYKLECWGAQGGQGRYDYLSADPGKGGYSQGILSLTTSSTLYLYSGGAGQAGLQNTIGNPISGGFNGGGNSGYNGSSNYNNGGGSGGGASDVRINSTSLYARVIVAGGGGAGGNSWSNSAATGGYGGGITGGDGTSGGIAGASAGSNNWGAPGGCGSQTSGGVAGLHSSGNGNPGSFGNGGNGYISNTDSSAGGGGGGGWYGGGAGAQGFSAGSGGGGGGSGYVYTSSTASSYPSGCLLDSRYYLTNAQTIGGNTSFTSPTGSSETGHSGNGYVRITQLNVDEGVENISNFTNCFYYNSNTSRYETNITPLTRFYAYYKGRVKKNVKIKFTFGAEVNLDDIGSYWMSAFNIQINENEFQNYYITQEQRTVSFEVALKDGDSIYIYCYSPDQTQISGLTKRIPYFTMTYENLSYIPVLVPNIYDGIYYSGNTYYFVNDALYDNSDYNIFYSISGTTSATNAGNYTATLSLIDTTNTKWSDGTTANKTLEWNINPANSYLQVQDPHYISVGSSINLAVLYNGDYDKLSFISNDDAVISIGDLVVGDGQGRGFTVQANKIGRTTITINNYDDNNYSDISKSITIEVILSPWNCAIKKGKQIIIPQTSTFMGNFENPTGEVLGPFSFPPGRYKLECWGAQGGIASGIYYSTGVSDTGNNRGGYTSGILTLTKTTPIWFGVGGSGIAGGFNGGGKRENYPAGGGGTDVRIGSDSLYARVIVAGGGGSEGGYSGYLGGAGGGLDASLYNSSYASGGYGGNQTGVNNDWIRDTQSDNYSTESDCYGGFGFGGNGITVVDGDVGIGVVSGAGGGGWYGGAGTYTTRAVQYGSGGGGGSNYVYTLSTASSYPLECLLTPNYYLSDTISKTGQESIPQPNGFSATIGNYGDGVVIITVLDGPTDEYIKDNGEWYYIKDAYIKVNNEWKLIKDFQANYNGRWLTQNE